jgi:hypothetical protein
VREQRGQRHGAIGVLDDDKARLAEQLQSRAVDRVAPSSNACSRREFHPIRRS